MQANRYFLVIKVTILIYAFAFLLQSCQNNKSNTPGKANDTPDRIHNSFASNKEDTFVIGDIHTHFMKGVILCLSSEKIRVNFIIVMWKEGTSSYFTTMRHKTIIYSEQKMADVLLALAI